ncbi:hypothetical protein [Nonomuraea jabiensis]|uniref:hypothetical protein n=1 Tax=Nonomuraea jabiensis TaxID=882448 RepID=UPI003D731258
MRSIGHFATKVMTSAAPVMARTIGLSVLSSGNWTVNGPQAQVKVRLHGALGHEGEHGVRASEGDQGGAGEEQTLGGEDAAGAQEQGDRGHRQPPGDQPDGEDLPG